MNQTPTDPLIGRTISQYDVVARLGGGGMGVVYRATDTKLGRTVALKFLPPQWSHDESAKQRFLREAQAASATNHRNICVIHDIDQTDDGQLFIVMAYYEGQTLKQKLDAGPLPVAEATEIASEIAEGLAKAHALGVVHRDIKPGNLIVTDDGVKVLDFGLATFADAVKLTLEGSTIGTAAYMSPEQVRGDEADARSDVWALGVVMYEMLTGEVPFKGGYAEAIFHAIKFEPVSPISRTDGTIPVVLERIVLRALEKDPADRYQSARELARELRMLQGRTVPLELRTEALPDMAGARIPTPTLWHRVRREVTGGRTVAVVLVLAAAGVVSYRYAMRPVARIPVAIAPVANRTGDSQLDDYRMALTQILVAELSGSPNIRVVPYPRILEVVGRFKADGDVSSREAIQAIGTQTGARFIVAPALAYRNGTWLAQAEVRNVETGTNAATFETEAVTSSLPKDTSNRLVTLLADAIQEHFKANGPGRSFRPSRAANRFRTLDAARAFEEGVDLYERLEYEASLIALQRSAAEDGQHAMTHAWLSRVLLVLSRGNEAVPSAQRARQLVTAETPGTETAFIDAVLAESVGDVTAAKSRYQQLIVSIPDDPMAHLELADFLKRQNDNENAVTAYHDGLPFEAGHIRPHVELCQLYTRLDDQPMAEREAQTALESYRAAGDGAGEAQALMCLGEAERVQGGKRLLDAQKHIEAARDIFASRGLAYGLARSYFYLGNVASSARDYPGALRLFSESLTRSRAVGNRLIEGLALMNLGVIHERLSQRSQALDDFQRSQSVYEQLGDQRRAAEGQINAASLLVNYGSDQAKALAEVANARATFHKLGYINFEVLALQVEAQGERYSGRQTEARRQLLEALSVATERQLGNRVVWLNVEIAKSELLLGDYDSARARLEQILASDAGHDDLEARIALGHAQLMLGEVDLAETVLQKALVDAEATGQQKLVPVIHELLGELAYDTGKSQEAQSQFTKAAAFLTDELPEPASVEARCYQAVPAAASGLLIAKKLAHLDVESRCRLALGRAYVLGRRYDDALSILRGIPLGTDRTAGRETEAAVHYWLGRALGKRGDPTDAQSEINMGQQLMRALQATLPTQHRERFGKRTSVSEVIGERTIH